MIHKPLMPGINTMGGNGMKRSLQYGSNTSRIDIMVRESIQNSFDALDENADNLNVNYSYGSFRTYDLAKELDGVTDRLIERFADSAEFLEFRDTNTAGLDGPLESSNINEYGKLIKLVYSIAEKQNGEGKGGSWGYGKTNYYNLGIGLVIYYSNTLYEGSNQQRLVAVLVEDTDHREDMLLPDVDLGISYWGREGIKFPDRAIPVTDPEYIRRFLQIFGLEPFGTDETGTSIIIPFIDRHILLDEMCGDIVPQGIDIDSPEDFKYFVELAVQRWYFPRLLNMNSSQFLRFSFNGELLADSKMEPLFRTLRDLYNKTFSPDAHSITAGSSVLHGKPTIGYYATSVENLNLFKFPYGMNVYGMLGIARSSNKPNAPIGFRCRSLGMINRYDVEDGIVKNATPSNPGECKFVALRPEGSVLLYNPSDKKPLGKNLEDYIRLGENPPHNVWSDLNIRTFGNQFDSTQPRIVYSMITSVASEFSEKDFDNNDTTKRNLGLSKKIGKLFLPAQGFGRSSTASSVGAGRSHGSSGSRSVYKARISDPVVQNTGSDMEVTCNLDFSDGKCVHELSLSSPANEDGLKRNMLEWSEEFGLKMPIYITKIQILSINSDPITDMAPMFEPGEYYYGQSMFEAAGRDSKIGSLKITHSASVKSMQMKISIECHGCPFKFNINLQEVE